MSNTHGSKERRIYNIGGHGGSSNLRGNSNQKLLHDLNDSLNARKFDQYLDLSHDNLENMNLNSSRLNYSGVV